MDDYDVITGADEYYDDQYDDHDADLLVDDPIDAYSSPTPLRYNNSHRSLGMTYSRPAGQMQYSQQVTREAFTPQYVQHSPAGNSFRSPAHNGHGVVQSQWTRNSQPYQPPMFTQPTQPQQTSPPLQRQFQQESSPIRSITTQLVNGIQLRAVSELPDLYRGIFKYGVFNAVQSKCWNTLMFDNSNTVVTAPTGSGKTVLFELAMIRLFNDRSKSNTKAVYMAPTKALCTERHKDWSKKFEPLGIRCCELTGDTPTYGKGAWGEAPNSRIIVTTPEKWDSLTRNWSTHEDILDNMKLFLIDEVHILNESRGSTLEVCVARMNLRGVGVRFILVSATAPNISDIAHWIGKNANNRDPAVTFAFGEEFRPIKLKRFVHGFPRKNQNDFGFQKILDFKTFSVISQHSTNKPVLIFCPTRKGTAQTAEQLMKDFNAAKQARGALPWHAPEPIEGAFKDSQLQALAAVGIGVHHAGLHYQDRQLVEELFIGGTLRVIVATSTLAVGVNLPAHTVVIKGTQIWQSGGWQNYSEADILQMMGRAGRPQFGDKEGVAIIMCDSIDQRKYESLVGGEVNLESCLHLNIAEFLNAEIGLRTVSDMETAKTWLRSTFFHQRIQRNPLHYNLNKESNQTWTQRVDALVNSSIQDLKTAELVASDENSPTTLVSTPFGDIMSKYYIRLSTMRMLLALPDSASLKDILETLCRAEELSEVRIRAGEKQVYNKLRTHDDIRFKIQKVDKTSDKIFVLIQAILGGISLADKEYSLGGQAHLDAIPIFRHCPRFARALADIGVEKRAGALIKWGLELVRSLNAKAWEGRPVVLRQIEHLGEKSIKVLIQNGVTSLEKLRAQDPIRIEALLNRRLPFGLEVLQAAKEIPEFRLRVVEESVKTFGGKEDVTCTITVECGAVAEMSAQKRRKQRTTLGFTSVLTTTSDESFVDFRRISTKTLTQEARSFTVTAKLSRPSQCVEISISAENFVGTLKTIVWKPSVPASEYPVPNTRPKTEEDMDVEMMMQDSDFWAQFEAPMDDSDDGKTRLPPPASTSTSTKLNSKLDKKQSAASAPAGLVLKPNGKYDCNHSCKDKTTCRHLCCRDGLDKPPKSNKLPKQNAHTHTGVHNDDTTSEFDVSSSRSAPSGSALPRSSKKRRVAEENLNPTTRAHSDLDDFFQPDEEPLIVLPPTKKRKVTKTAPLKQSLSSFHPAVTSSNKTSVSRATTERSTPDASPSPPPTLLSDSGHSRTPLFLRSSPLLSTRENTFLDLQLESPHDRHIPAPQRILESRHSPSESASYRDFQAPYFNNAPVSDYDAEISWMMDDEPLVPSGLLNSPTLRASPDKSAPQAKTLQSQPWTAKPAALGVHTEPMSPKQRASRDKSTQPQAKISQSWPWKAEPAAPIGIREDSTLNDELDSNDALAEFEAWLSSGNVIITD